MRFWKAVTIGLALLTAPIAMAQEAEEGAPPLSPDAPRAPFDALSARERAVASLVQRGLRNKEVASELGLTEGTVKVHLHKVFDKLGIRGRTELILLAQERGD